MAQQLLRSPALGAARRSTQATCVFQTSKLLSIRAVPQKITPFVSSSSPAQTARPLSRPLRSASDDKLQPVSSWDEGLRQLLQYLDDPSSPNSFSEEPWRASLFNVGIGLLEWAALLFFSVLYPSPTPDRYYGPQVIAFFVWWSVSRGMQRRR